jgi:sec-independent protein translocase protein TatA
MRAGSARRAEDKIMGDLLQPWHLVVLGVVAFLLFGAKRLPELGKGLGEGLKGFKEGIKGVTDPAPAAPRRPRYRRRLSPRSYAKTNGSGSGMLIRLTGRHCRSFNR